MKRFLCLVALALVFSLSGKAQRDATDVVYTDDQMPAFTVVSDDGTETPSARFSGKVILINFFATWCPPCQAELAEVEKTLWPRFGREPDFVLLVIGREHSDAELTAYNAKKGFSFPLYPDKNRQIFASFATQSIPRSYLIDRDGKILHVATGYEPAEFKRILRMIDNALTAPASISVP
ncbi:MAG: TlpA family protein disulfide reductase [Tannerella sp.]|jgi:peroxiredoxin|nr:TlpA family protein disulfide reductase [Tannerella sp.]